LRRKLIFGLVVVPLGVALTALSVANRAPVLLVLDPFGGGNTSLVIEAPLFLYLLGAFGLGLAVGGFATWLGQAKWRRSAKHGAREADEWRRRASRLEPEPGGGQLTPHRARLTVD